MVSTIIRTCSIVQRLREIGMDFCQPHLTTPSPAVGARAGVIFGGGKFLTIVQVHPGMGATETAPKSDASDNVFGSNATWPTILAHVAHLSTALTRS
jgi:hypothetical protein